MVVTIKGVVARPDQQPSGFVWWGTDPTRVRPSRGLVPWRLSRRLRPDRRPPVGCGGKWYYSERAAVLDLARVVTEVLNEERGTKCLTSSTTT